MGSFVATQTLVVAYRLGSVVHRLGCSVACGILVPRPGIEPVSAALQSEFPIIGSPGKTLNFSTSQYKRKIN